MNYRFLTIAGVLILAFHEFFVPNAYAYLDPSVGMAIIQGVIGALVGVGIALKIYWTKIKYLLSERLSKTKNDE